MYSELSIVADATGVSNVPVPNSTHLIRVIYIQSTGCTVGKKSDGSLIEICSVPQANLGGDVIVADASGGGAYTSLNDAVDNASAGDTIFVCPGVYNNHLLLKDEVNWFFLPGAIVEWTGAAAGAIFDDGVFGTNSAVTSNICGCGQFINSAASDNNGVIQIVNGSTIGVQAASISTTGVGAEAISITGTFSDVNLDIAGLISCTTTGGTAIVYNAENGNLKVRARKISANGDAAGAHSSAVFLGDGTSDISAVDIEKTSTSDSTTILVTGVNASRTHKVHNSRIWSKAETVIKVSGVGTLDIDNCLITQSNNFILLKGLIDVVTIGAAVVRISNSRIESPVLELVGVQILTSIPIVILNNVILALQGDAKSIESAVAVDVLVYSGVTNKPTGLLVTQHVSTLIEDVKVQ